jgi:Big-like domain-containing protein
MSALVMALAGCGRRATPVALPPVVPPTQVQAMFPAPRSLAVWYDVASVWAQFAGDLDSTTVNDHTVFLKVDQLRQPITATWNGATRRIVIQPVRRLDLQTTYTVIISTGVKNALGVALPVPVLWQFTTNSLRRVTGRLPADGAVDESPHVSLEWSGNDSTPGVHYQLFVGGDSAGVAVHAVPSATLYRQDLLPATTWDAPATLYWTVTAVNDQTGERQDAPVWRFTTLDPAAWPVDSVVLTPRDWGTINPTTGLNTCGAGFSFQLGSATTRNLLNWGIRGVLGSNVRVADARMRFPVNLSIFSAGFPPPGSITLRGVIPPMGVCGTWSAVSPPTDNLLGPIALSDTADHRITLAGGIHLGIELFSGDRLAAHVEAVATRDRYDGYLFESSSRGAFSLNEVVPARLTVHIYRRP